MIKKFWYTWASHYQNVTHDYCTRANAVVWNLASIHGCNYVVLPQKEWLVCNKQRKQAIAQERKWWKLTISKQVDDSNLDYELLSPRLDQSQLNVALKARLDPLDKGWFSIYYTALEIVNRTADSLLKSGFWKKPMTSYSEYKHLYEFIKKGLKVWYLPFCYILGKLRYWYWLLIFRAWKPWPSS